MDFKALSKILTTIGLLLLLTACYSESDNGGSGDEESRVVISTGDTIIPLNDLQYQLPLVVQVADSNGSPQANVTVSITLSTLDFQKGFYTYVDTDGDAENTPDKWVQTVTVTCPAEDINNNGVLDDGEDRNSNTLLDPDTPTITSHPDEEPTLLGGTSLLITDDNGFGYFTLSYPKTEASWVSVRVSVTAEDGLPENKGIKEIGLFTLLDDHEPQDDPPAFVTSPYGSSGSCEDNL